MQCGRHRTRRRYQADLADTLDAVGSARLRLLDEDYFDGRNVLRANDAEAAQRHQRRAAVGIAREVLGECVAEAHVHGALDLPNALHRVDRAPHIVGGDHPLDVTGFPIDDDELRRVAECGMDHGMLGSRLDRTRPVDAVFAQVVDADAAIISPRGSAGIGNGARAHQRAARPGRLTGAELTRRVDDHPDARRVDTELFDRNLRGHGMHALTHFGPAVPDFHGSIGLETHDRTHDLEESISEPRVLQAQAEPDRAALGDRGVVRRLQRFQAAPRASTTLVHHLPGSPHLAGFDDVALPDLPTGDADLLREPVEGTLHRKLRLVRAEAAERSAHGIVRAHREGLYIDRREGIRTTRVARRTLEHLHPDRGVRAGVADHPSAQRGQMPL